MGMDWSEGEGEEEKARGGVEGREGSGGYRGMAGFSHHRTKT
jgi:hypothetical protein